MNKNRKTYLLVTLGWFIIVAILGLTIRTLYVYPIGFNYKYILHAHSHIAFLGWGFNALMIGLLSKFSKRPQSYDRLFWMTQICIFGFGIGFLTHGYHIISITFSTLFLFVSYFYAFRLNKELNTQGKTPTVKFAKSSLFYLVIASIGPWAMGPIMAMKMIHSIPYFLGIFFYLHFTYNGFFVMAMIALLFKQMEDDGIELPKNATQNFYYWTNIAVIPTYALSTLWVKPHFLVYFIAFVSSAIQLIAFVRFYPAIRNVFQEWQSTSSKLVKRLYFLAFWIFGIKLFIQLCSAFPIIADIGYKLKSYFVIGYLHLIFLGLFSLFFIGWHIHNKGFRENIISKIGIYLFIIGFLLTEIILFGNGFLNWARLGIIPKSTTLMFYFSIFLPIGLITFWIGQSSHKNQP